MKLKLFSLVMGLLLGVPALQAKVELPSVLASNMVLQQKTGVKLWGKAKPSAQLTIKTSWNNRTVKTKVGADGKWEVEIYTSKAGGPYEITFNDGEKLTLENILLGEVWLCMGQSNMEMPIRGFDRQPHRGGNDIIARSKASTPIRIFNTDRKDGTWFRQSAKTPQEDMHGES